MKRFGIMTSFAFSLALMGCDSRIDVVSQEMANIQNQKTLPIDTAPATEAVSNYAYAAQQLRNPFIPGSIAQELSDLSGKRVYINPARQKQELENYPLESLNFKGSMKNARGQVLGLVQAPDGEIKQVEYGNYMGLNQGRIVKITPTQIDLKEVVPDGRDGFIERPRSLVLIGQVD